MKQPHREKWLVGSAILFLGALACGGTGAPMAAGTGIAPIKLAPELKAIDVCAAIPPDQIEAVTVKTSENLIRQFTTPVELKTRPKTSVDAQFSLPYSVATLLYFKRALTDEYSEKAIHNAKVLDLATRVHCMSDPEMNRRWPKEEPSEVTLRLKDGTEYKAAVSHAKGSLGDPMTEDELKDKFRFLAGMVLKETAVERIIDIVTDLENLPNVKSLIRVISAGSRGKMSRLKI